MAGERVEKLLKQFRQRYQDADKEGRTKLLDEFCLMTRYHRKYATALLKRPHFNIGSAIHVPAEGEMRKATVVELPFVKPG